MYYIRKKTPPRANLLLQLMTMICTKYAWRVKVGEEMSWMLNKVSHSLVKSAKLRIPVQCILFNNSSPYCVELCGIMNSDKWPGIAKLRSWSVLGNFTSVAIVLGFENNSYTCKLHSCPWLSLVPRTLRRLVHALLSNRNHPVCHIGSSRYFM